MASNQISLREKFQSNFNAAYDMLNKEQRQAVDLIEGPVMVIAGPGTGKTQILAVRIGKILEQQDVSAHNILCLTFTDAATVAMRERLVKIIGPEGHKVHIHTFHGFCNQVIQENLGHFGNYRKLDQLSDLEKIDVFDEIMDALPINHLLKRPKGDPRFEAKRLENLFAMMKRENLNSEELEKRIDLFLEEKKDSDEFLCKRKTTTKQGKTYVKGDFRDDKFDEFLKKFDELKAASSLFEEYKKIMDKKGRYDFADMILWVVDAFKNSDEILSKYQERYHYFLVDEYQDTNGAQNELLYQLINFMDLAPNVFVVGDDDQAIYKFQGANLNNIREFKDSYSPQIVILEKNYRSSQVILDAASELIDLNLERIVKDDDVFVEKNLIAAGKLKDLNIAPKLMQYANTTHEQAAIVAKIETLHKDGFDLSKVAVMYRNHRQAEKLVEVLEKKKIPINIKKKIDILKLPLVKNILNILFYIQSEYDKPNSEEVRLFEIMHYHFFNINARDIAKIAIYKKAPSTERGLKWRDIIGDKELLKKIGIGSSKELLHLDDLINKWVADIANLTLQSLYGVILNEGYILQSVLNSEDKTWLLQIVSTMFDIIKEDSAKKPDITLKEFLDNIVKMKSAEIPMEINKVVHSKSGVNFITAHSSKGLEFEHVFMIGCTKNVWDKNKGNRYNYSYPTNVNSDVEGNVEDERRLFFVAMTRAESNLEISFALKSENEKDLSKSQFVDEIIAVSELQITEGQVSESEINEFQFLNMLNQSKEIHLIDHDLIDKSLKNFKMSVTNLSKYLKCPMTFYFETILRVPSARSKHMGFGSAVHQALQEFFEDIKLDKKPNEAELLNYFGNAMNYYKSHFTDKEFKELLAYGNEVLSKYHNKNLKLRSENVKYFLEEKIDHAEYKGVPIKGVLDKVEVFKDHVNVVDYKTGNAFKQGANSRLKEPNAKNVLGGDYWRQIVFYKLLLDSDKKHNWNMVSGEMDFVEPKRNSEEFAKEKIVVKPIHLETVGEQILETWDNIQNHKFNSLCEDERCYWCNFVRDDYVFNGEYEIDLMEEIQDQ